MSKREPKHMGEVMSNIAERYNKLNKRTMNKEIIIELLDAMNIDTYIISEDKCAINGINGQTTILYYEKDPFTTIKQHLIQMGEDSLRMELNSLLLIRERNYVELNAKK